jgi:hypothetical protein
MSGIGGILLYTFTSCCDKIERHVSTIQFKSFNRRIQILIHTCFGGSLEEYIFGTYGMVSTPKSTRLTLRMASDFRMGSAENREGSKTPRLGPGRVCSTRL